MPILGTGRAHPAVSAVVLLATLELQVQAGHVAASALVATGQVVLVTQILQVLLVQQVLRIDLQRPVRAEGIADAGAEFGVLQTE